MAREDSEEIEAVCYRATTNISLFGIIRVIPVSPFVIKLSLVFSYSLAYKYCSFASSYCCLTQIYSSLPYSCSSLLYRYSSLPYRYSSLLYRYSSLSYGYCSLPYIYCSVLRVPWHSVIDFCYTVIALYYTAMCPWVSVFGIQILLSGRVIWRDNFAW